MVFATMMDSTTASTFQFLLSKFVPNANGVKRDIASTNRDTLIGVRIRPLLKKEEEEGQFPSVIVRKTEGVVDVHEIGRGLRGSPKLNSSTYRTDRLYDSNATTETVYKDIVSPLLPLAWNGGIGTLFAYGQTGSGKTFTVNAIEKIVAEELLGNKHEGERHITASIFELAGSSAYDLLNNRKPISILEDSFKESCVVGVTECQVRHTAELIELIDHATQYRTTAATERNAFSSRSHAICRLSIVNPFKPSAPNGLLYLVDLAGSEAARDTVEHGNSRMKETLEINTSLSVLKECIRGRAHAEAGLDGGKKVYIPFRQSTLTKTLKHIFDPSAGRPCKTSVIACVNPSISDAKPSRNTLRYAEMLNVAIPNAMALVYDPEVPKTWSNEELKEWISKQPGTSVVNANILAPFETGTQLVRLPQSEFIDRCLETPGVTTRQARVMHSKLWSMHVDAQSGKENEISEKVGPISSAVCPELAKIPFQERIRPGMVVSFDPKKEMRLKANLALVLSPDSSIKMTSTEVLGSEVDEHVKAEPLGYLCAMIYPSITADSYELSIWNQMVISVEDMQEEMLLEYDATTRYYYLGL